MHRRVVEGSWEGIAGCVVHVHIRKLGDISPINIPLSHQLESYNTLKHRRNIDIFGHKMILRAEF